MNTLYKNKQNEIFGLSPLDIDNNRHIGLTKLTAKEVEAHLNPAKTDEEIEQIRIDAINSKANELIEARYSFEHKQVNILAKRVKDDLGNHYNDDDILEMNTFIDGILLIAKQAKANSTAVEDIDWSL